MGVGSEKYIKNLFQKYNRMKFRFLLTVIALITYGLLFLFFGVFSYATDTPHYSGFPLAYKIEGCGFGCPSTEAGQPGKLYGFYPISLMQIFHPVFDWWFGIS